MTCNASDKFNITENRWTISPQVKVNRLRHTTNNRPKKQLFQYILSRPETINAEYPMFIFVEKDPNNPDDDRNVGLYVSHQGKMYRVNYKLCDQLDIQYCKKRGWLTD